jgi:NitT/TauT family transport system substrate-binding protein
MRLVSGLGRLSTNLMVAAVTMAAISSCSPEKDEKTTITTKPIELIIDWQPEPTYLGIYFAKSEGLFSKAGFDVTVTPSWGANQAVSAVASGKFVIGTASGGATLLGRNNGANVVSLGVLYPHIPSVVYGLASSGIKVPADLRGKRIGIYPGSVTVNEFDAFRKINGLEGGAVKTVSLTGADIPLLLAGKLDGVLHYTEMSPVQVETSPKIKASSPKTYEIRLSEHGVGGYGLNIIANPAAWKNRRAELQALTNAIEQGYREGCADRKRAVDSFVKQFPDKSREYVARSWDKVCTMVGNDVGHQDEAGWSRTIALYRSLGVLKANVRPTDIMGN